MELQTRYNGRLEILRCHWEDEKLIPDGKWTESNIENLGTEHKSLQNKCQLTSSSDEQFSQIFSDIQNCEPQDRRMALKKLWNLCSLRKEALPSMIHDGLPVLMNILKLEEDADKKSEKEVCLDIILEVLCSAEPQSFLEGGCLLVFLEICQFLSYLSAKELWDEISPRIMPHLKSEHVENAIPILEKNINSKQYVNSAMAYKAYAGVFSEFMEDEMLLGKLLSYEVVLNMHEALKNPIWQNSDTLGDVLYVLTASCDCFSQYKLELHKMDITSTLCYLLTNSYDIPTGKLELLERSPYITENIVNLITGVIPQHELIAYRIGKLEKRFEGCPKVNKKLNEQFMESQQRSEELTNWLKQDEELTFRCIGSLFRWTQEIFLKTTLLTIKLNCIECLELIIIYDNQAWKSFFQAQDVCEELIQLLSLKEFDAVEPVLYLVSMLLDIAPEFCAQQFLQNGLREQIAASMKRNKDEDHISSMSDCEKKFVAEKFEEIRTVCIDFLPNGNDTSHLVKLQAAIISLNTRESVDMDSLEVIRQIIQDECIDVNDLAETGLIRSLLYFLTGVDTNQRSLFQSTRPSELIMSLDDAQKQKRDNGIKMFLRVFLGLSTDSLCSPVVRPGDEKSFIKLLKLLMTNFTVPNILENTTDIDNTEIDDLEKFCKQKGIDEPSIYHDGPKHVLDEYLVPCLPQYLPTNDLSSEIAALLSVLYGINKYHKFLYVDGSCSPLVSNSHFINQQLSWNIEQQVNEPHDSDFTVLPSFIWKIIFACPFLISFESRLSAMQKHAKSVITNKRLREKTSMPHLLPDERLTNVTISRRHIIDESKLYFSSPLVCLNRLGVHFRYEEPETGPGVVREYYSLVSKELQNSKLNMWKDDTSVSHQNVIDQKFSHRYALAIYGLYPKPSSGDMPLSNFKLLGKLMAKVLVDGDILDVNLHECIYKLLLRNDYNVELADLISLDPILGRTMKKMQEIATERMKLLSQSNSEDKSLAVIQKELSALKFDGVEIEDLCLNFTLPGYPDVELTEEGKHVTVKLDNLQQYVELVLEWFMKKGVQKQIMEIRDGFNCFFPTTVLKVFYPDELNKVFCGSLENQTLLLKRWISMCDTCEGYTKESQVVKFLSQIVSEYDTNKQRDFLMFVSGFPRLVRDDKDEFANILMISRCPVRDGCDPDDYLPRAATCYATLMLPDYSSIDIMRKKLNIALADAKIY